MRSAITVTSIINWRAVICLEKLTGVRRDFVIFVHPHFIFLLDASENVIIHCVDVELNAITGQQFMMHTGFQKHRYCSIVIVLRNIVIVLTMDFRNIVIAAFILLSFAARISLSQSSGMDPSRSLNETNIHQYHQMGLISRSWCERNRMLEAV